MNIEQGISNFEGMSNSLIRQFTDSLTHSVLAESAVNAKARLIRAEGNDHFEFIMQNKANLQDAQMNVSIFSKMAYKYKCNWTLSENKPNQSQPKPVLSTLSLP